MHILQLYLFSSEIIKIASLCSWTDLYTCSIFNTIRLTISLDTDQAQNFVAPDLCSNCFADHKSCHKQARDQNKSLDNKHLLRSSNGLIQ